MEKFWKHGISTYSLRPNLATRANIESTIGSTRKTKKRPGITGKIIIEAVRAYEDLRYRTANLAIKISTNKNKNITNEKH